MKYQEIRTDFVDANGVTFMDGWQTMNEDDGGSVIAYIVNGEPYYRDLDDQFLPEVKEALASFLESYKTESL
tara:strand:- start:111 stop:326 length:216 start_codon:yes stop_codon:yes gene_type:complete